MLNKIRILTLIKGANIYLSGLFFKNSKGQVRKARNKIFRTDNSLILAYEITPKKFEHVNDQKQILNQHSVTAHYSISHVSI